MADVMTVYRPKYKIEGEMIEREAVMQKLITDAVSAYIDGTTAVTSEDAAVQAIIDLALLGAEGGRETDITKKVAENLSAGNTADMMLAMPLLCAPYNGFPRTLNMMSAVNAALAEIQETEETIITMQIGNPNMTVNNETLEIDHGMGTTPVIQNDRTLLPVRAIIEALGGAVEWNGDTRTATLSYGDDTIALTIDNTTAYLNNAPQTLDVAPVIINDRTMLPIRFIAENFGFDVDWTQETQTVTITKSAAAESTPIPTVTPVPTTTPTVTNEPTAEQEDYDPDAEYDDFKPYDE
jgi:alkylhydroperoxidase/carboxymuconolactone decarboxylase family protein YurZ